MINTELDVFVSAARAFGEDDVAEATKTCSLAQQRAMCLVSGWLQLGLRAEEGKRVPNQLAEATAAQFIIEGHPRELARKRAKSVPDEDYEHAERMLPFDEDGEYDEVITPEFESFWRAKLGLPPKEGE